MSNSREVRDFAHQLYAEYDEEYNDAVHHKLFALLVDVAQEYVLELLADPAMTMGSLGSHNGLNEIAITIKGLEENLEDIFRNDPRFTK